MRVSFSLILIFQTWYESEHMAEATSNIDSTQGPLAGLSNCIIINPENQVNSVNLTFLFENLQVLVGFVVLGWICSFLNIVQYPSMSPLKMVVEEWLIPILSHGADKISSFFFSFLLASMTESVQSQMIRCETYAQI